MQTCPKVGLDAICMSSGIAVAAFLQRHNSNIQQMENRLFSSKNLYIILRESAYKMTIDTNTMISITEANQNFSKVARVVDEHGTALFWSS